MALDDVGASDGAGRIQAFEIVIGETKGGGNN